MGNFGSFLGHVGNFGSFLGHFGNFGSFLGHFGQFWVIFGLFWVIFGPFFCANFFGQKSISAIFITFYISGLRRSRNANIQRQNPFSDYSDAKASFGEVGVCEFQREKDHLFGKRLLFGLICGAVGRSL